MQHKLPSGPKDGDFNFCVGFVQECVASVTLLRCSCLPVARAIGRTNPASEHLPGGHAIVRARAQGEPAEVGSEPLHRAAPNPPPPHVLRPLTGSFCNGMNAVTLWARPVTDRAAAIDDGTTGVGDALYMAAPTANRYNPAVRTLYKRLRALRTRYFGTFLAAGVW